MATAPTSPNDTQLGAEFYDGVPLKRGLAWLVDVAIIAVVAVLLTPFTAFTAIFFFPVFMLVIGFFYRWMTIAGGSATWGMRLFAIELRDADGMRLNSGTAFAHTAAYTAAVIMAPLQLVSVVLMATTTRGQGLGDLLLDTVAINKTL